MSVKHFVYREPMKTYYIVFLNDFFEYFQKIIHMLEKARFEKQDLHK